jgi:hypothetical protein
MEFSFTVIKAIGPGSCWNVLPPDIDPHVMLVLRADMRHGPILVTSRLEERRWTYSSLKVGGLYPVVL